MPYQWLQNSPEPDDLPDGGAPIAVLDAANRVIKPLQGTSFGLTGISVSPRTTPATDVTAGPVTYTTAQLAGGLVVRDPAGLARTDVLPAAADIIADLNLDADGDTFVFYFVNIADAAEAITFGGAPSGVTYANAGQTIGQNESAIILLRRTSPTTVTAYIVGA